MCVGFFLSKKFTCLATSNAEGAMDLFTTIPITAITMLQANAFTPQSS